MNPLQWLRARDPGLAALRRAARAAIVMPAMFALGERGDRQPDARDVRRVRLVRDAAARRLQRPDARPAAGAGGARAARVRCFVCVGTLASRVDLARRRSRWRSSAFGVLFAGRRQLRARRRDDVAAAGVHPAGVARRPGLVDPRPARRLGHGLGARRCSRSALLWPAPARDPLRAPAIAACRALAARLRADVAYLLERRRARAAEHDDSGRTRADAAVAALHRAFLATPVPADRPEHAPRGRSCGSSTS